MCRTLLFKIISFVLALLYFSAPAFGTVIQTASGFSSVGTPILFKSELTFDGNILIVRVSNLSGASLAPNDLLCSYFFDIVKDGSRPALQFVSATGDVYLTQKENPDTLQTAGADLKAVTGGDGTWQFKTLDAVLAPFAGFGIGTVGNNNLSPNNFNGHIVGNMNYGIYAGDVSTQNLSDKYLIKNSITFTFSGVSGFGEADIAKAHLFGLGTAPDSLLHSPEPATIGLLGLGLVLTKVRK